MDPTADSKPWWMSKTLIGSAVTILALAAGFMGVEIDADTKKVLVDQTEVLMVGGAALIGTLLTIYGRLVAKKPLH